ncbi:unnamed protein product [Schistosoma mattheei]|uniref:Uncharacterized protein n=1 Tax=Schistosoma mattheei TaxID=31246 RepID=A0A183P012_9TREM|nr:unnamed protein product [Schistosoma mattheei]
MCERKNKKTAINNSVTSAEKVIVQAECAEVNEQVKRSIRDTRQACIGDLVMTAEKAVREGSMKQLYNTAKKLEGKYYNPERPVKDKEGKPITAIQERWDRWVEHFEELLNIPAPLNPPDIEAAAKDMPIDVT